MFDSDLSRKQIAIWLGGIFIVLSLIFTPVIVVGGAIVGSILLGLYVLLIAFLNWGVDKIFKLIGKGVANISSSIKDRATKSNFRYKDYSSEAPFEKESGEKNEEREDEVGKVRLANKKIEDAYYQVLEVDTGARFEQIKQAYKDLVKVWHPDRFNNDSDRMKRKASAKLCVINEAYTYFENKLKSSN